MIYRATTTKGTKRRRVQFTHYPPFASSAPSFADHIIGLERCHPAGHRLHSGQPELQAWERRVNAGLLRGGEHLFPQVSVTHKHPPKPSSALIKWTFPLTDWLLSMYFSEGSNLTPAHHFPDFRFKTYAPVAFRYFRELFGIRPDDYLVRFLSSKFKYIFVVAWRSSD